VKERGEYPNRIRANWLMTVLGLVLLGFGVWFGGFGIGILAYWRPPGADDPGGILLWFVPLGGLAFLGVGFGFLWGAWYLAGDPIKHWWWRRKQRKAS
jgi:hypothetical protein